jgi:hypothetical protein
MKPKATVEASWLNQSLPDKLSILAHLAPQRAKALEVLFDAAFRDESQEMKPGTRRSVPQAYHVGRRRPTCDEP